MATNSTVPQPQIYVLSERDYDTWFTKMRTILHAQDLWEFVTIGYPELADQAVELALSNAKRVLLKENRRKDNKALGIIQQGLSESIFPNISSAESSKKAWDTLETCYQGVTKVKNVKLQNLRRDFENLKMKDNETVDNFMTQVMSVVNQLRQYGEDLPYQRVIEKLLRCFPKNFEVVVVPIEEFKNISQMHIDELTGYLIAHESIMNRYDDTPLENAFKSHSNVTRGRGRGRTSNKRRGG